MKKGIIILGHGSKAAVDEANQLLLKMVALFKEQTGEEMVAPAWMTKASGRPGLAAAAASLIGQGCRQLVVAPWFLTAGVHIQEDIPAEMAALKAQYPQVGFVMAEPLGADPRLVGILQERIQEVS